VFYIFIEKHILVEQEEKILNINCSKLETDYNLRNICKKLKPWFEQKRNKKTNKEIE